ncbi:MAG: hypothetical protein ACP5VN_09480 [Acidobacteriota bacterium]
MARKAKGKRRSRRPRKLSRFDLSRRGEIALAAVGLLLLAAAAALLWLLLSPRLLGESAQRRAEREREEARQEALWQEANRSGLVLRTDAAREEIVVSSEAWEALLPPARQSMAAAARARFGWGRCFVRDGKTGKILGWTDRGGDFHTPRSLSEGSP